MVIDKWITKRGAAFLIAIILLVSFMAAFQFDQISFMKYKLTAKNNRVFDNKVTNDCPRRFKVNMTLPKILELRKKWASSNNIECREKAQLLDRMYEINFMQSGLNMSTEMENKMLGWLDGKRELLPAVYKQLVISIMNKWTYSATIYNLIRSKRPKKAQASGSQLTERQYVDNVVEEIRPKCDFCQYNKQTAEDVFGRIIGKHSFTATNVFKLEEWHSLVIFREHHPLKVSYEALVDSFETLKKWFEKVQDISPKSIYPMVFWETMGHAGASQPHPHFHPFFSRYGYYGYFKQWQQVSQDYSKSTGGRNYFTDIIDLHNELGLAVFHGKAVVYTPINPKKDYEFIVISQEVNKDFLQLLYFIFRAYIEDLDKYCFSIGISFPPMKKNIPGLPVILRIVTRGSVSSVHADVTSMELFSTSLVETDPYRAIRALQGSIQKRRSQVT